MLSSRSFTAYGPVFKSLIHFEFIFLYSVRQEVFQFLLHVAVQFPQYHLLKRLCFLHCIFLPLLSKIRCPQLHEFISGLFILFPWSVFLFLCQYHLCLDDCRFVVQTEVRKVDSSSSIFLSEDYFHYLGSFVNFYALVL